MDETNNLATEVQDLVWALVDEEATDGQVRHLEDLLLENDEARRIYVMCMQMHADLHFLLGGKQLPLPAALEEAIKAQKTKAKPPLPVVDLPPMTSNAPISNGFAS